MSNFAVRCFRAFHLRVAKHLESIRYIHQRVFNPAKLPHGPQTQFTPRSPRDFILLLATVFAASLDDVPPPPVSPTFDSEHVLPIKKIEDLEAELSDAGEKLVVIFCMVRWCPFCRKIAPTVEDIANKGTHNVVMLKLDMDDEEAESSRIVARYGAYYMHQDRYAVGLPTFVFLKGGTKLEHFSSADDGKLRGTVKKYTA